jgi:hypothetical protein
MGQRPKIFRSAAAGLLLMDGHCRRQNSRLPRCMQRSVLTLYRPNAVAALRRQRPDCMVLGSLIKATITKREANHPCVCLCGTSCPMPPCSLGRHNMMFLNALQVDPLLLPPTAIMMSTPIKNNGPCPSRPVYSSIQSHPTTPTSRLSAPSLFLSSPPALRPGRQPAIIIGDALDGVFDASSSSAEMANLDTIMMPELAAPNSPTSTTATMNEVRTSRFPKLSMRPTKIDIPFYFTD